MVNRCGWRYWSRKRLSFKYNDVRWHTVHILVNWFSFSLFRHVEKPQRMSPRLNILQSDGVFSAQLGDLRGIEVSSENLYFFPLRFTRNAVHLLGLGLMSWINACHAFRGAGHATFPPGMNHFDCHPPLLLYLSPLFSHHHCKELGLASLQSCSQSTTAPPPSSSGGNRLVQCVQTLVQWGESAGVSCLAVTCKRQSLCKRRGNVQLH